MMLLFILIISFGVLIDYVEILSGEYNFEVQVTQIHSPKVFQSSDITLAFYYSQFNNESEDDNEAKYNNSLTILSRVEHSIYVNLVSYRLSVNRFFHQTKLKPFHEYNIPPPQA
jgi:hypothetical protein